MLNLLAPDARGRKAAQEHFSEESFQTKNQFENAFQKLNQNSVQYSTELMAYSKLG
jgi:aspartate carbamoyltransferase catalytic subunit